MTANDSFSPLEVAFGQQLNVQDPDTVIDLLDKAAAANRQTTGRRGSVIDLPESGQLVMTGDLHDHAANLQRILAYSRLEEQPNRYLVLHEVIHGPNLVNGADLSVRTLVRVAALKAAYPDQVILLQSNHELAQRTGHSIFKGAVDVVEAFENGLSFLFGPDAADVHQAFNNYVASLPLAAAAPGGVMACHSLPAPRKLELFDPAVLDREPTEDDLVSAGSASLMVWGRHHGQPVADQLGQAWGVSTFVMGHQPAEMGYQPQGETMLILASDHDHGVLLPIDLARPAARDDMLHHLVPLNSIPLPENT
jgi:hypothetical protein